MNEKLRVFIDYFLDRLKERSTWEAIGFVVALTGSKFGAGMDWGLAAGLAASARWIGKMRELAHFQDPNWRKP